jgi:hypothetical protein
METHTIYDSKECGVEECTASGRVVSPKRVRISPSPRRIAFECGALMQHIRRNKMTKAELIERVAKEAGITKAGAEKAVNAFTNSVTREFCV